MPTKYQLACRLLLSILFPILKDGEKDWGNKAILLMTTPLLKYFQFHSIYSFEVCSVQSANIIHSLFKPWLLFTLALSMYCLQLYACKYSTNELKGQLHAHFVMAFFLILLTLLHGYVLIKIIALFNLV